MDPKLFVRYIFRETMGLVVMGVALFWSAGRLTWWPAWALLIVMDAWITATAVIIMRINPGLLAERLGPRKGAKTWDTVILSVVGLLQLARYIIAGLDQRYSWTGSFPDLPQAIALIVCIVGYVLVTWATASNKFFSQIVRIQSERGHSVETGGPYRYVRHPAYIGAILYELAAPVVLSSWWAIAVSLVNIMLMILRTDLEDLSLQTELVGYKEYVDKLRWRLLPGVW